MAFVDQTALWVYKKLIVHSDLDAQAENSKIFNDLLTATTDMPNDFRFDNAKAIAGEVAAGGSYKDLIQLDASDVCQLGESGTEIRVPADPTNVLGVASKQYVDGVQMFQTQAIVSVSSGVTGTLATILNLTATTRGRLISIWALNSAAATLRLKITLDSVVVIDDTSGIIANADYSVLRANGEIEDSNSVDASTAARLINLPFNSTCLIEAASSAGAATVKILYSKIP